MSALKSFVNWLGLGPDEGEPYAGHFGEPQRGTVSAEPYGGEMPDRHLMVAEPVMPVEPVPLSAVKPASQQVSPTPTAQATVVHPRPSSAAVRPVVVAPVVFDEAQEVGDHFKARQPVIVNLQDADSDLRRRLVDFAAGLCYALEGQVERVTPGVYLLTPSDVSVALEERTLPGQS